MDIQGVGVQETAEPGEKSVTGTGEQRLAPRACLSQVDHSVIQCL